MYYGGLRVNEAATLRVENVDTNNRIFGVIGKGSKPRLVPYPSKLDRVINLWLQKERKSYAFSDSPFFFPSKRREHISPRTISNMIHNYAESCGIQKVVGKKANGSKIYKVHGHILRHSYASDAVDDGIPITLIQKMMGHSCITTTIGYMSETKGFKSYYEKFSGI